MPSKKKKMRIRHLPIYLPKYLEIGQARSFNEDQNQSFTINFSESYHKMITIYTSIDLDLARF